jgi:hypothetical protein
VLNNDNAAIIPETLFLESCLNYRAYGLLFSSDIRLDHFTPVEKGHEPDVFIRKGAVVEKGYTPPPAITIESSPGKLVLRGARSATFLVAGGDTVTIDPLPGGNPSAIKQILLGWAFAGLFHQRAMPALHGSVICYGDDCFVICAPSGGGKSTLTSSFLNKGFSFLDDNIAMAEFCDEKTYIVPGSPELRLWANSMGDPAFEFINTGCIRPELDKFSLIVKDRFRTSKARLKKIFLLKNGPSSQVVFEDVKGAGRFKALFANVFCVEFIGEAGYTPLLFEQIHKLAENVPVVAIQLPEKRPTPDELRDIIISYLGINS